MKATSPCPDTFVTRPTWRSSILLATTNSPTRPG